MTTSNVAPLGEPSARTSTRRSTRGSARGICFWYPAIHLAKAAASCRYRMGNLVELLSGADAVIASRLPPHLLRHTRVVSCLRPIVTPELAQSLAELRECGVALVADYDDLLFSGEVSGLPSSVGGSGDAHERRLRLERYSAALGLFDRFTVSTRALAARLGALAPAARVEVIPNALSAAWVEQGNALYPRFKPGDPRVIRYFAGSPSHDRDFELISPVLIEFLEAHADVRLEVVGPLRTDASAFPNGRITQLPSVSYDVLPRLLASTWVNLAPLVPSEFNDCKSAIKFLESAAFGCPTLASPNDDVLRHRALGAPVAVCRGEQDWYEALEAMLDTEHRMALGLAAERHVAAHGMAHATSAAWLAALGLEAPS